MSRFIFLDTGPLGIVTNPKRPPQTVAMLRWAAAHLRAGNHLMVPAVADYEVRRELIRLGRTAGIAALDLWNQVTEARYIALNALNDSALKRAANLWAEVRNRGLVTADPKELDCDALIAAQVLEYQVAQNLAADEIIVATTNVGHLSRFVAAELWSSI